MVLENYFVKTTLLYDVNKKDANGKTFTVKESKVGIFARDVAELAIFIQNEREILDPLMKIGLDSGQASL